MARVKNSGKWREWSERLERFVRSDLTVASFCRQERVSAPLFYQWRARLKGVQPTDHIPARKPVAEFLPVRIAMSTTEIHLPSGARVSLPAGDMTALRVAIEAVSQLPTASIVEDRR